MQVDDYSKAIGIVYATSHMMHLMDESVDVVAMRMYTEALSLLSGGDVPKVKIPLNAVPVPVEEPREEPVEAPKTKKAPKAPAKKPYKNRYVKIEKSVIEPWRGEEDYYIRVAPTLADAIKNKPLDSNRTAQQISNRWYYLRQTHKLLTKGMRVFYSGENQNLVVSFEKIKGTISAFTDDKTSAVVYFDSESSAYTIPVSDLTPAGEA